MYERKKRYSIKSDSMKSPTCTILYQTILATIHKSGIRFHSSGIVNPIPTVSLYCTGSMGKSLPHIMIPVAIYVLPPHDATSDSGRYASLPPPAAPPRGPSVGGKRRRRRGDRHRPPPRRDRDHDDYPDVDDDDDKDKDDAVIFVPAVPLWRRAPRHTTARRRRRG